MTSNKKQGGSVSDMEARAPLVAIVLADSFAQKFRPITLERPKVLLPLVNIPMIDYTLEWLLNAGVEEVLVFCCAHARQVESYLEKSNWKERQGFKVSTVVSNNCSSAGDAMRLIDAKGVVRSDFILVSGDTISNMSLTEVLEQHRERRKVDKQAIMTMVTRRERTSKVTMQSRLGNDEHVFIIDSETKQLLHYDHGRDYGKVDSWNKPISPSVRIDFDLLQRPSIDVCVDLQDCHIDICAPEVLFLFTDNFDYQQIRRDFVKGVLGDEIIGNKIFTYELRKEYAARIDNLRAYDAVSRDVMARWTYPFVPDTCFARTITQISGGKSNVSKEKGVVVAQTAKLGPNVLIGEGTRIGENAIVSNSVVGMHCTIGNNVRIENSYIWNDVHIGDRAQVQFSILCDGVTVQEKAVLEPGTVLSFKVVIGDSFRVRGWSKISRIPNQDDENTDSDDDLEYTDSGSGLPKSPPKAHLPEVLISDLELAVRGTQRPQIYSESEVGVGGAGYRWPSVNEEEEVRLSIAPIPEKNMRAIREKVEKLMLVTEDRPASLADSRRSTTDSQLADNRMLSEQIMDGQDEEQERDDENETKDFYMEMAATFRRAVFEGAADNNIRLEIMGLKSGYNKSFADCASGIFRAMMDVVFERQFPHATKAELKASINKVIKRWGVLLSKFLLDMEDQVEVLLTLEEICQESDHKKEITPIFQDIVKILYDLDVITEDAVLMWANEKKDADEADRVFLKLCEQFIKWLETAEEEESDEEPAR